MSSDYVSYGGNLVLSNEGQGHLVSVMMEEKASLRTPVRGGSMYPFIRDHDVLTIAPLGGRVLTVGDVAAFKMPGTDRLFIHRIVGRNNRGLVFKGDSLKKSSGTIPVENVLGLVVCVERDGKIVYAGLGFGKKVIALLSRSGWLVYLRRILRFPGKIISMIYSGINNLA